MLTVKTQNETYYAREGICLSNICVNACYIVCFALLSLCALGKAFDVLVLAALYVGVANYGGSICIVSSFVKLSFPDEHIGMCIGHTLLMFFYILRFHMLVIIMYVRDFIYYVFL